MKTTNHLIRTTLLWSCALALLALPLPASAQTLVHRYSFDNDGTGTNVVDSVGGTDWYGTMTNGGDFDSLPGELLLSEASQQFVQLPVGILSNYTAVTIDCWATFGTLPNACFLYGFGDTDTNVLSGGLPSGYNYIYCQPRNGFVAISDADPGWQHEQGTGGGGNWSGQTVHVTAVYDPPAGYIELYTNGVLVSRNTSVTIPMSAVTNQLNYLARSLYEADGYMDVALDEFRIWDGALNPLQVAGADVGGPDTVSTDPGTITSIQLNVPYYQLTQGGHESGTVSASASSFSGRIDITRLSTYASTDTNILAVDSNGTINAVGQGSANIIASYTSLTSTQLITVVQPASALTHRYSFSDANGSTTVADSVNPGGTWDGTIMTNGPHAVGDGVVAPGNFTGSQLMIASNLSEYIKFPAGIDSNYTAVSVDVWATFPQTLPANCFLFGFGDTDSGSGAGYRYIFMQPRNGAIAITRSNPGWNPDQPTSGGGNWSGRTVHATAVFNPLGGYIALYTNGVLVSANRSVDVQINETTSVLNYIARSLYTGDSYMDVNLDEFRVFSGAMTSQGVAIADAAGPDSVPAAVTNGPGSLMSLSIQAPATLVPPLTGNVKLLANYEYLSSWDIIRNSVFPPAGLTVSVSDTNVLRYNTNGGALSGVNPGTASVVTVYQGITNTASVTVVQTPSPTLTHRYSFASDASDSVGGPAWNGTMPNGATFASGQVSLAAASSQYVQLPAGIISNYTTISIETWVTFPGSLPGACCIFNFGDTDTNGAGCYYIFCQPQNGRVCISTNDAGWQGTGEQNAYGNANWASRTNLHVVAVVNPSANYIALYTNGVLAGINTSETMPLSGTRSVLNYIGRSLYTGDSYLNASVDEFRIYNGVMSPYDVQAAQILGPDYPLSPALKANFGGGNVALSWPTNYVSPAFTLQSRTNLVSGGWQTEASPTIVGDQFQVIVSASGGSKFYRLAR